MTESDRRFFSWYEANRTLPLVRRIVEDVVDHHARLEPALARYKRLTAADRESDRGRELKRQLDAAVSGLDALVGELRELGCLFKGFSGLVDWYSYHEGRPVFLCWKLGEKEIEYWHPIEGGFVGRQEIGPDARSEFSSEP